MEQNRLLQVRSKLEACGLDALLVTSPANRRYLTGFTGSSGAVLISSGRAILITDFRYTKQASEQTTAYEVIQQGPKLEEMIHELLRNIQASKLGFEQNGLNYGVYASYRDQLTDIEMVPTKDFVETIRAIKDASELSAIQQAVEITTSAFDQITSIMKPGVTEQDISAELEYFMRRKGASSSAYSTIVASGERSALPHGVASGKALQANEFVTLDFGALYEGYCSDLTRTVFIGAPSDKQKEIYRIVLEANRATLAGIKPGMTGREADSLGRDLIAGYGYGDYFGHGLGHGFGLEIHEPLRLSQSSRDVLEPGMVLTVEPGIYIPGFGGVRIEDDILITETGIEVLTASADKELILL
ncbi:Xaa-Pro peptidase family protein [Paenibacillus sp. sptzw28]|uniref:M24 family metallopeptidase n=1 Tax=Paenibacillus sp. sptzw28 TaxID=715179 RepID=UPI001C6EE7FF|nr:Xaa-Pro peptidase family protein [Paenibacillus sp. sptzw28]QYR24141.1 Xaa-Pro peptidase family protein [Paenibacillus sp. sptzw28]